MKIWIINNYNMLPEHGPMNRSYYLCKYLKAHGHEPTVFVGSHPHNTNVQLIEGKERYKIYQKEPFPWVLIKTLNYNTSKIKRVLGMAEFYFNLIRSAQNFEKPDVIMGSSSHPLAALAAITLGKRYKCQKIVEIRDLWPESVVSYGVLTEKNLFVKIAYKLEKYLYIHADKIVFTMENAWQYIVDKGLDKYISKDKIYYLNNGVDLESFTENLSENPYHDDDLSDGDTFKIVYTGSVRKVNNLGKLIDAAKIVKNPKIKIIVFGDGYELEQLRERVRNENVTNIVFKGSVNKKYIASITSQADVNYIHGFQAPVLKYGLSANKLFDYAAAGKPILCDMKAGMNPAEEYEAAIILSDQSAESIAEAVDRLANIPENEYKNLCKNAASLANDYSWENLAIKFENIISI